MPLPTLLLVLFSSFLHAGWNYLAKTIPGGPIFVWLLAIVMAIVLLPFSIWQILSGGFDWTAVNIGALVMTGVLHTVYFLVLQKGYQEGDLSVVYPLARGMGPVFSGVGAFVFLHETFGFQDVLGLLLVGAGALLIGGFSFRRLFSSDIEVKRDARLVKGIYYGLLTGFLISCYTIFDGFCVTKLKLPPILVEYTAHPIRFAILFPLAMKNRPEALRIWQGNWIKILIISIVSPFAFILVLYAMKSAPVHAVAPVREFSIVIGVLLGARFLAEENMRVRLVGSVFILCGIGLLAMN